MQNVRQTRKEKRKGNGYKGEKGWSEKKIR